MPAKPARFPSSLKLGGDVTSSGRSLELSADGVELIYGDAQSLFSIARGEKALTKRDTKGQYVTTTSSALDRGRVVVGFPNDEDGAHVDVCTREGSAVTLRLPGEAVLHGCIASVDADAVVAWGWDSVDTTRPHLWWWSLASPTAKPTAIALAPTGMVSSAAFVGVTLFVTFDDQLFAATPAGVTKISLGDGLMPNTLAGARTGAHLLARSANRFVVLTKSGKTVHALPRLLKCARLTSDGAEVVGVGMALRHQQVPPELRDAHPEWMKTDFIARFDANTGARLGWGPITDAVDLLAIAEGELIVTKSVKRIAFHPWKLVTENA